MFPDHHHYSKEDLKRIVEESLAKNIDAIITTAKDAVKLPVSGYSLPVFVLRSELKITANEQIFLDRLLKLYSF
jgi:tetraacyldisaccharide 4'-kinase